MNSVGERTTSHGTSFIEDFCDKGIVTVEEFN